MQRDHRPYFMKKAYRRVETFYVNHFLRPQLESLGRDFTFMKPWNVEIFGGPIRLGDYINVIATPDMKVRLAVWPEKENQGRIHIGNYCLICPGVRIGSGAAIDIGDSCMMAKGVYVTDSDWHGIYNRIVPSSLAAPIRIEDNVWLGDSVIVCKGVTIGQNSIIGAGAVVTSDVPANVIAAGNPARVVKHLDPNEKMVTRAEWFANPAKLSRDIDQLDREMLHRNNLFHWLRHCLFPAKGD